MSMHTSALALTTTSAPVQSTRDLSLSHTDFSQENGAKEERKRGVGGSGDEKNEVVDLFV